MLAHAQIMRPHSQRCQKVRSMHSQASQTCSVLAVAAHLTQAYHTDEQHSRRCGVVVRMHSQATNPLAATGTQNVCLSKHSTQSRKAHHPPRRQQHSTQSSPRESQLLQHLRLPEDPTLLLSGSWHVRLANGFTGVSVSAAAVDGRRLLTCSKTNARGLLL